MVAVGATAIALGTINSAQASTVVRGTIVDNGNQTNSIDYWDFGVTQAGTTTIDVAARDLDFGNGISSLDPFIYLLRNDGSLDASDFITANDDSSQGRTDGSIHRYDSFISTFLDNGNYTLAISNYSLSLTEVLAGENSRGSVGDYQITFSDNVNNVRLASSQSVPEPASILGLIAVTAMGAASLKRKLAKAKE